MIKNNVLRKWHRDLGYFFIGLIISFCISGIAQNHRSTWNPKEYEYASKDVLTRLDTLQTDKINDEVMTNVLIANGIKSPLRGVRIENDPKIVKAFFDKGYLNIDLNNGKGKIEFMKLRPVLGQMSFLHTNNNFFWTLYSDLFALGLITIAIIGLFMVRGKYGFKQWGYKLMLAGLLVPLILVVGLMLS